MKKCPCCDKRYWNYEHYCIKDGHHLVRIPEENYLNWIRKGIEERIMILNILFPNLDIPLDVLPAAVLMFSLLSLFLAYMILLSGKVTNAMIANIVGKMIIKRKAMGVWKFKASTKSH